MSIVAWGLGLNVLGTVLIALPDLPRVNKWTTPKELRIIISQLEEGEMIEQGDTGFSRLMKIAEQNCRRLPQSKDCIAVSLGLEPYGNPKLKGDFGLSSSPYPRNDLIEWRILKEEVKTRRNTFRYFGLAIFSLGFILQLKPYVPIS